MEYRFCRKDFYWGGAAPVCDGGGRTRYTLRGEGYSMGRRLFLLDLAGREAVSLRQQVPALMPVYALEVYGKPMGELERDLSFVPARCHVKPRGWVLENRREGLRLLLEGTLLGEALPEGETLKLTLPEGEAELLRLGVLLAGILLFPPEML